MKRVDCNIIKYCSICKGFAGDLDLRKHNVNSGKQICSITNFLSPGDEQKLDFAHEDVTEELELEL